MLKLVVVNHTPIDAKTMALVRFGRAVGLFALEVGKQTFRGLRYLVFYVLMWLRGFVHTITSICAGVSLLAFCVAAMLAPDWGMHSYLWKLAGFSFSCFLFGWLYDGLVLIVSPEPLIIDNNRS